MSERELPEGWVQTTLGVLNSYVSKTFDPKQHPDVECELYSVPVYFEGKAEKIAGSKIGSTKQYVKPGDVLISKINPRINRVWKVGKAGDRAQIASSEWIVVRQNLLQAGYLRYYFQSPKFRKLLNSNVSGVGGSLTRARPKLVADYPVPFCPEAEQKAIADKLDEMLAQVNNLKARLDAIPPILKRFRQSVLESAVRGEITSDLVFGGWESCRVGDVVKLKNGFGFKSKDYVSDGGIPVIRISDLVESGVRYDTCVRVRSDSDAPGFSVRKGDLLVAMSGATTGKMSVYYDNKYALQNQRVGNLKVVDSNRLIDGYRNMYFLGQREKILKDAYGGAQPNISGKKIEALNICLPGLEEQKEIVRRVDNLFTFADQVEQQVKNAQAHVNKLTQSILAKAFRGELTTEWRAANPELISGELSARALLERIKAEKAKQKPAGKGWEKKPQHYEEVW